MRSTLYRNYFAAIRSLCVLAVALIILVTIPNKPARAQVRREGVLVRISQKSPFDGDTQDSGQSGTNYPDTELEPYMAVNPRNPRNIIGIWQQDRWDNGGCRGLVAGVSVDSGGHWKEIPIPDLTLVTGGTAFRASDPWISFGPTGDVYICSLVLGGISSGVAACHSSNGGLTWSTPTLLIDDMDANVLNDKEAITADPLNAQNVYCIWDRIDNNDQPVWFTRSTDAGKTWAPARLVYDPGQGNYTINNQIVVLPNGQLLNFFVEGTSNGTTISLIRSHDKGVHWTGALTVAEINAQGTADPNSGTHIRTGGLFSVSVNATNGTVYVVWQDQRFSNNQYDQVAFSMSTDGGARWTKPIRVDKTPRSTTPARNGAFQPSVAGCADGTIAVTYFDFRYSRKNVGPDTDYWAVFCKPGAKTAATDPINWGHELRLTDTSFNMNDAPDAEGLFVGDYQWIGAVNNDFHVIFSQTVGTDLDSVFYRRLVP